MPFLNDSHLLHSVGAIQCVVPIETPIIAGNGKIRDHNEAGLRLDEVAFTIFYPANVPVKHKKGLRWLTGPLKAEIAGFGQFLGVSRWITWLIIAPIIYLYGQFIKIPVYQDAPILNPAEQGAKWPLVIFSHGLGGNSTAYSQVCTRLAASGRVVVAMEHRDGTGPACIVPYQGHKKQLLYIKEREVRWIEKPEDVMPLRVDQLIIRQHEIYTAYAGMATLASSTEVANVSIRFGNEEKVWTNAPISLNDICLAGHSFGGCTMFAIQSSNPPAHPSAKAYPRLPVRDIIIFDPWLEPLPTPDPTPFSAVPAMQSSADGNAQHTPQDTNNGNASAHSNSTRLLVINSEPFTLWTSHFERLAGLVKGWSSNAKLVTLVKSTHISFSDYRLLPLISDKNSARLMDIISQLSVSFLDSQSEGWSVEDTLKNAELEVEILKDAPQKIVIGKWEDGSNKHRWVGHVGQVLVH